MMNYRTLGRTGLRVSEIGLGCEGFVQTDDAFAAELLETALSAGINCMDLYTPHPDVHKRVARAIRGKRQEFVLQAHLCTVWEDGQYRATRKIDEVRTAFETMLTHRDAALPAEWALGAASALADAAGIDGMVGGQVIDLESEGKEIDLSVLEALQQGKTAALLIAACVMGVRLAGGTPEQEQAARSFGENLGLSFQIIDDILDVTATAQQLGKPVGSDAANQKVTYVSLLGLDEARRLAAERTNMALSALDAFGDGAEELRCLAEALLTRDH